MRHVRRLLGPIALALLGLAALAPSARATTGAPAPAVTLSVVQTSDSALTLDSNSPVTAGPHAMYISYQVTNTGTTSATNLTATVAGFPAGIVLGNGQAASQYIGTLAPGASASLFWFITYNGTIGLNGTLTVSVSDGTSTVGSGTGRIRTMSMISAQAGGLTSSASIGAGAVVGQLITLDVAFQFKGWNAGDSFDLQPAGNNNFPGGCFQLVRALVVSADAPLNQVIVPGTADRTYFVAGVPSNGGGSTWNAAMRYTFKYLCAGTSATPLPYSNELSGTQLKYSSNYGTGAAQPPTPIPAAPSPTASFTFGKTAASTQLPAGGTETYTVAIRNISTFDVTVDQIQDVLPAGVTYVGIAAGSGVTPANSASMPAAGATGTLVWKGNPGSSYAIAAGATLNLVYTTTVTSTAGQYVNSASALVGTTSIGSGSATVTVGTADITVTKTGPSTAAMQDTLKYLVTAGNLGPSTAYQVVVRDTLPSGVTFVSATNGGTVSGGVVTWPAQASLAVGATINDSVYVLAPNTMTTLLNKGAAATASYDPTAANNNGSDTTTAQVKTTLTLAISVLPKGPATPTKLVPNAIAGSAKYFQPYTVANVSSFGGSYALNATRTGTTTFLQIDSLTGPGITTRVRPDTALVTLAAHSSGTYRIWYTIPVGDTVTNTGILRARNAAQAAITDTGWVQVRRTFPSMTIRKTVSPTGVITPGTDLAYTLTFGNVGEYAASAVVVLDSVPKSVVSFKVGTAASSQASTIAYSKDAGATWAYTPVSGGCAAPAGYDACVDRIRWTLAAPVAAGTTGLTAGFTARIK